MKLYHCADARSLRPLWALEELGADYELINMAFPPRATYPGYLSINPLGTVPTFVDGTVTLTESTGICHYLGEKFAPTDLRVDPTEPAYGEYLNWMYRSDATLTFPQTIVLRYTRLEPMERRLPQAAEDYTVWYLSRLRSVEAALEDREFLCAGRFTMADIAVHYALFLGETLGLAERYKPRSRDYLERLKERPAFGKAREKQSARAD
ncbi:glutathione S-transferase family protein [Phenylobacterium sp.]|jgi:glutathione S-transferase|uniref:glutathione S-transferase family protein n=1 Tax=Phenylobacterium sp. TaxID=1871053 RepID=UPI0037C8FD2D